MRKNSKRNGVFTMHLVNLGDDVCMQSEVHHRHLKNRKCLM
jgi:hypothetical protein